MLRHHFQRNTPAISHDQALRIARHECEQRGWPWREPVQITAGWGVWNILTNATARGMNARFSIDQTTGEVKYAGYVRR